jgi:hypothetical protein
MKLSLEKKLRLLKTGAATRVDPRARVRWAFQLIRGCLKNREYKLERKSQEFVAVKYAAGIVIGKVISLRKLRLWDSLVSVKGGACAVNVPMRELREKYEFLTNDEADPDDVVAAMDAAGKAVLGMLAEFSSSIFRPEAELDQEDDEEDDEDDEDEEREFRKDRQFARYECAALLPALAEQMEKVWLPLKQKISQTD